MLISAQKKCLLDKSVVIKNVRKKFMFSITQVYAYWRMWVSYMGMGAEGGGGGLPVLA